MAHTDGHRLRLTVGLALEEGASGRVRLAAATGQIQQALAAHVSESSRTHGLALPDEDGWMGAPQD